MRQWLIQKKPTSNFMKLCDTSKSLKQDGFPHDYGTCWLMHVTRLPLLLQYQQVPIASLGEAEEKKNASFTLHD